MALLEGHDEGRRASAATYRHVATCRACRSFRAGLKDTSRAAAMLVPAPLLLVAIGLVAGKFGAAGAKGAMLKTAATAGAGAALAAGVVVGGLEVFGPGEPAPQSAKSIALVQGGVAKGAPLPPGTSVVRRSLQFDAAARRSPGVSTVTLPCPPGLRVADLLSRRGASAFYARETIVGWSRTARVVVKPLPGTAATQVGILCKAPDARGSIVAGSPLAATGAAGTRILRVRVARSELFERPGGAAVGSVRFGQPVQTLGGATQPGWRRVRTDTGATGWVRARALGNP